MLEHAVQRYALQRRDNITPVCATSFGFCSTKLSGMTPGYARSPQSALRFVKLVFSCPPINSANALRAEHKLHFVHHKFPVVSSATFSHKTG